LKLKYKMKIVTFQGGLGNQMYQYVFYNWLKSQCNDKIYGYYPLKGLKGHNGLEIQKHFNNIDIPKSGFLIMLCVFFIKIFSKIVKNKSLISKESRDISLKSILYEGYWQDLSCFTNFKIEDFEFNVEIDAKNKEVLNKIISTNSVSIHIRRGDYLSPAHYSIYGNICTLEYYDNAISYIESKIEKPFFFIFSDDIEWVNSNLNIKDSIIIDWNRGEYSVIDMFLMSKCHSNIIANSTFSWWGAFLNSNKSAISICPKKWFYSKFKDPQIFKDSWKKI